LALATLAATSRPEAIVPQSSLLRQAALPKNIAIAGDATTLAAQRRGDVVFSLISFDRYSKPFSGEVLSILTQDKPSVWYKIEARRD
jgi:hypothetical protein